MPFSLEYFNWKRGFDKYEKVNISDNGFFDLGKRADGYLNQTFSIGDEMIERYENLVIFGMGGSSLGAKTLCGYKFFNLYDKHSSKRVLFVDNIHYHNFSVFLKNLNFDKTAFLIISKSGQTIETLCQTLILLEFYKREIKKNKARNLYFVTELSDNPLNKIAKELQREIIIHDHDVGGRYSCFTPVALIPAYFCGVDIKKFIASGKVGMQRFLEEQYDEVSKGAAFLEYNVGLGNNIQVFMPYLHRLYHLTYWYNQLLAESVGKNGLGITPLKALGSVDQHSVLQLFLDGPNDKFFSFLTLDSRSVGDDVKVPDYLEKDLGYFLNNQLGDVIYANQESTIATIKDKDNVIRRFDFTKFDEEELGEIMMYFMLETIMFAQKINVNPFDQPAVEEGKKRARSIMEKK